MGLSLLAIPDGARGKTVIKTLIGNIQDWVIFSYGGRFYTKLPWDYPHVMQVQDRAILYYITRALDKGQYIQGLLPDCQIMVAPPNMYGWVTEQKNNLLKETYERKKA